MNLFSKKNISCKNNRKKSNMTKINKITTRGLSTFMNF